MPNILWGARGFLTKSYAQVIRSDEARNRPKKGALRWVIRHEDGGRVGISFGLLVEEAPPWNERMTNWAGDSGWTTRALGGLVLALWGAIDGTAAEPVYDRGAVLVFHEENDLFVNTDRHYTQGIRFAYLHEDGHMPLGFAGLNQWLPNWGFDVKSGRSGYSVGQNIYTPADLDSTALVPADRPYAGWLYLGAILQRNGVTRQRAVPVQESWELELGVIGPTSLARQAQTWVHEIRGFDVPRARV